MHDHTRIQLNVQHYTNTNGYDHESDHRWPAFVSFVRVCPREIYCTNDRDQQNDLHEYAVEMDT